MKGRWESNMNVWFPFLYSQKRNCAALLFPKQNYCVLSPNSYTHISVRDLYISMIGLSWLFQPNMWTDPGNICINRSQTRKCRNWGLRPRREYINLIFGTVHPLLKGKKLAHSLFYLQASYLSENLNIWTKNLLLLFLPPAPPSSSSQKLQPHEVPRSDPGDPGLHPGGDPHRWGRRHLRRGHHEAEQQLRQQQQQPAAVSCCLPHLGYCDESAQPAAAAAAAGAQLAGRDIYLLWEGAAAAQVRGGGGAGEGWVAGLLLFRGGQPPGEHAFRGFSHSLPPPHFSAIDGSSSGCQIRICLISWSRNFLNVDPVVRSQGQC